MERQTYATPLYDTPQIFFNAVGEERCQPKHSCGPKIRQHYLFHFVVSGKGVFKINNKTYNVEANQGFLIPDSSVIYYEADKDDPWHYCWLNLQGGGAKNFFENLQLSRQNPIYTAKPNNEIYSKFQQLIHAAQKHKNNPYTITAHLFSCLYAMEKYNVCSQSNESSIQENYVQEAKNLIATYYHHTDLTIEKISRSIGIDRSYLSRLFNRYEHISIQRYLIEYRLNIAKELLKSTHESIATIADSVGYSNVYNFTKIYKKTFGSIPSQGRK